MAAHQPGFKYQFRLILWLPNQSLRVCTPQPCSLCPRPGTRGPGSATLGRVSGGLCGPAWLWRAGLAGEAPPHWGLLLPTPRGLASFQGWGAFQGQAQHCTHKPQAARPCPPFNALRPLISLLSSFPPSFSATLPSWRTFDPPEHLRSLASALWPSNSSFSSAAASPQFSAAGSTPSH